MALDRWWSMLRLRTRSLLRQSDIDREVDEELRDHVERQIEALVARGLSPEEARTEALRTLGGIETVKEHVRDARGVGLLQDVGRDVRYGVRILRRSPIFTAIAVASLALGTGANTAIFQLLNAVRLSPLRVSAPEELAIVEIRDRGWPSAADYGGRFPDLTYGQWDQLRTAQQAFAGVLAWSPATLDLNARGESRFAENGLLVSGDFFNVLGVRAQIGRVFSARDDVRGCGAPGVVLSHSLWQREYGGAVTAIGATMTINDYPFEVIGVTPPAFVGVEVGRAFDLAIPLCADALLRAGTDRMDARMSWWLAAMGRLKPGWSIDRASEHLAAISEGIFARTLPDHLPPDVEQTYRSFTLMARPGGRGFSQLRDQYNTSLLLLFIVAGIVLLTACANLANLLLARMGARAHEMAVRLSLGASRARLMRQLLGESLLLAGLGTALGAALAPLLGATVVAIMATDVSPLSLEFRTDWRVVAFTTLLAGGSCVFFGLAPALRASRTSPGEALRVGGRRLVAGSAHARLRRTFLAVQVALSMVLLVAGLLFGRSFLNLWHVDAGFDPSGILEADIDLSRLELTPEGRRTTRNDLQARLSAIPGVERVAVASTVPMVGTWYRNVFVDGPAGQQKHLVNVNRVTAGYFATLRTPLLAGREFDTRDTPASPLAVIVNETFVERVFQGAAPIGRTVRLEVGVDQPGPVSHIVGLVRDTKYSSLREPFRPIVYLADSQAQTPGTFVQALIRTPLPLEQIKPAVKDAIEAANADAAFHYHDFQEQVRYSIRQDRLLATLCGFFALLGGVLAAIGVYGLVAYSVAQRRSEIGLRVALGATRRAIVALVLSETAGAMLIGIGTGLVLALLAGRLAGALLFGLQSSDPVTLAGAVLVLVAAGLIAGGLPAGRAARIDPLIALRQD
jgi:predicted permease